MAREGIGETLGKSRSRLHHLSWAAAAHGVLPHGRGSVPSRQRERPVLQWPRISRLRLGSEFCARIRALVVEGGHHESSSQALNRPPFGAPDTTIPSPAVDRITSALADSNRHAGAANQLLNSNYQPPTEKN